ncbi:ribosome assembly RNA-binding protein YhbY [Niveibacterium sp. SC-1]|uniref:ribosome assembly RNA-binding protein YhbY n=1 Tax=Niveibacterium sp. SC-1 TaxID=3135646 RepID=UPI00311F779E
MKELTPAQRRSLRAEAHHLDPVVSIAGNGLTAAVLKEIDRSLNAHGLIKIRVYGDDRELRTQWLETICKELDCAAIQSIGKLLVVFRPKPEPEPKADKASPRKPATRPRALKPESGRTARTTTGTSVARRLTGGIKLTARAKRPSSR